MKFRYSVLLGLTLSGAIAITAVAQTPTPSQKDVAWQQVVNDYQALAQALMTYRQANLTPPPAKPEIPARHPPSYGTGVGVPKGPMSVAPTAGGKK